MEGPFSWDKFVGGVRNASLLTAAQTNIDISSLTQPVRRVTLHFANNSADAGYRIALSVNGAAAPTIITSSTTLSATGFNYERANNVTPDFLVLESADRITGVHIYNFNTTAGTTSGGIVYINCFSR